jgi:cytochrome oxidase assembly protein ShyY1
MSQPNRVVKSALSLLLILILSAGFVELGLWQLHRAQSVSHQSQTPPEKSIIPLESVAVAGHNLRDAAYNRLVSFAGTYVKFYSAPRQVLTPTQLVDLDVGLMSLSGGRAILVVRGIHDQSLPDRSDQITVVGRLYPHQNEDHADGSDSVLSRLDPALVAGLGKYQLYDGYVSALRESDATGTAIIGNRIPAPQIINPIGGFYWQHIAYVITWWFMAILVLFLPLYSRGVKRKVEASGDSPEDLDQRGTVNL